jgi:hypothetical protein
MADCAQTTSNGSATGLHRLEFGVKMLISLGIGKDSALAHIFIAPSQKRA